MRLNRSLVRACLSVCALFASTAHAQTTLIRVAQARVAADNPGTTIFDANVVGVIRPWVTTQTTTGFYGLGGAVPNSFNGPVPLTNDRIHLFFAQTADGLSAYGVIDKPGSGTGGHVQLTRYVRPLSAMVADLWNLDFGGGWCGLTTTFSGSDSRYQRYVHQNWASNDGSEGWAIRLNDTTWTSLRLALTASPRPPCDNDEGGAISCIDYNLTRSVNSVAAYSTDGTIVPLLLGQDAVQFRPVAPCEIVAWPSQQSRCAGGTIVLSARQNTTGQGTFQWFKGTVAVQPSANITITTSADGLESRLTITNASTSDAGTYRCQITSACGSLASPAATVTVSSGLPVLSSPLPQIVNCAQSAVMGVTASGQGPFRYQWFRDGNPVHDVPNFVTGSDGPVMTVLNARPERGGVYNCVVSNACGSVTSANASLTVVQSRPIFSPQPATPQSAARGGIISIQATTTSDTLPGFQWQWLSPSGWQNIVDGTRPFGVASGATTAVLTITNVAGCAHIFRMIAANTCGCTLTNRVVVNVTPACCDDIDFNNNTVFPEEQDVIDFFNVLSGATCTPCNDIDFNNNNVFPEEQDVIDFFNVLAGGTCP